MNVPMAHPSGPPPEKLQAAIDQITTEMRKLGLYAAHIGVAVETDDDDNEVPLSPVPVVGVFRIGDIAWKARTQDPETARVDDEFRSIQQAAEEDEIANLRARYEPGTNSSGNEQEEDPEDPDAP